MCSGKLTSTYEDFTADLARISELCGLNGIELVLIKQPVNLRFRDTTTTGMTYEEKAIQIGRRLEAGERIAREETGHFVHSRMMEVVNQVAQAAHVHVMDFIPIVDQHPEFFASYAHITEAGNEALANELLQAIIRVRVQNTPKARWASRAICNVNSEGGDHE